MLHLLLQETDKHCGREYAKSIWETGRSYLDGFGGIMNVSCGHRHPNIVDEIVHQTNLMQHTTTIYLCEKL